MKIYISIEFRKNQICILMKIQINFELKKIKYVFNENEDQF